MPIISPKYPMTDFHEINLDYLLQKYFEIDEELKAQIGGLVLDNNANKLRLLDKEGNVIASVTVAFATSAGTAGVAASANSATSAQRAYKDSLGNNITSYVKSLSVSDNVIIFYDADGNNVGSTSIVEGSNVCVEITHQSIGDTDLTSIYSDLSALNVGESVIYDTDYSMDAIQDLLYEKNTVSICHYYVVDGEKSVQDFNMVLTAQEGIPEILLDCSSSGNPVELRRFRIQDTLVTDPATMFRFERIR